MSDDKIHHITSLPQLQTLFSSTPYIAIDFYADWCPPCKQIAPIYAQLSKNNTIDGGFAFAKVNVDHVADVAREYGISAMPTFMFFKEGKQVAVNGNKMIQGADVRALQGAVEKLAGLGKKRVAEKA